MNLYHLGVIIALASFAGSSIFYLQSFSASPSRATLQKTAYWLFVLATLIISANTVSIFQFNPEHLISTFILITSICWLTILAKVIFDFRMLGAFVAPLSMIILLAQFLFFAPHAPAEIAGPGALMVAHIITSVLGEAFAIIACVLAVFYLMQQRAMKNKQLDRMQAAQVPISKLNTALLATLWIGFILLTSGLIMGSVYLQFFFVGDRNALMGKIIWAFAVWLWYFATLVWKNVANLPAKKLAWMTIIGFGLLVLGLFGINNWSYVVG
ncbi:MAG: cytochrome c biogenesis protein CcsA [Chitinophagaceae bacterium]|nr:cytochrome c biogenesis protein CcsA [Oligoflexus sp.]